MSFDERAATWDDEPVRRERAALVAAMVSDAVSLRSDTRLLDVGAGTGLLSAALSEQVGSVTMVDTSPGMRAVMEDKVEAGVIPNARVWDLDLTSGDLPDEQFDVVTMLMALHHIPDLEGALAGLAAVTAPGGHLCIVDLVREDGSFHGPDFDGHRGFDPSSLTASLEAAGFTHIRFQPCLQVERSSGTYPTFFAVAVRTTVSSA